MIAATAFYFWLKNKKSELEAGKRDMNKFLLMVPVCVMLGTASPASAQMYPDAGLNRLEDSNYGLNRLDDPNYGWPQSHWRRGYDAYAGGGCRVIRERVVMPDGREIYSSREICG